MNITSFESVRLNACVHKLDLGLYSHPKEFLAGMESGPMFTPREKFPLPVVEGGGGVVVVVAAVVILVEMRRRRKRKKRMRMTIMMMIIMKIMILKEDRPPLLTVKTYQ